MISHRITVFMLNKLCVILILPLDKKLKEVYFINQKEHSESICFQNISLLFIEK